MISKKIKNILINFPYIRQLIKDRNNLLIERDNLSIELNNLSKQTNQDDNLIKKIEKLEQTNNEILFAHLFSDSIKTCPWIKDKSFSPYQGAANYSFLYKLFRIYDIIQPKNILEFGLGQTTKLTSQYVIYKNKLAKALVIDDNQEWIDIYKKQIPISKNIIIQKLNTENFKYKKSNTPASKYSDLKKIIKNKKIDLIIIDGPIGYGKDYPRTNILDLTTNLSKDWIIIIDDAEREGEQNTIKLLEEMLNKNKIKFNSFYIESIKKQYFISSSKIYSLLFAI